MSACGYVVCGTDRGDRNGDSRPLGQIYEYTTVVEFGPGCTGGADTKNTCTVSDIIAGWQDSDHVLRF